MDTDDLDELRIQSFMSTISDWIWILKVEFIKSRTNFFYIFNTLHI